MTITTPPRTPADPPRYARGILRLLGIGLLAMVLARVLLSIAQDPGDWRAYPWLILAGGWLAWLAYRASRTAP